MKTWAVCSVVGSLVAAALVAVTPSRAQACGGTFCDAGAPMPVDQSGENILFVLEDGVIEAHIQIQYTGDPAKFGWVIPLQRTPDSLAPGSEALFTNLLAGTVPQYGFSTSQDACDFDDESDFDPNAGGGMTGPQSTAAGDEDGGAADGGAEILLVETVGSFEITVLTASSAQDVVDWLDENGYQQDDESLPILQQYLDEEHVFAAVKLTDGAGLGEIHPIVLRFASNEPCVPLRLTRIAAVEDMEIRTFFLSRARVAPRSYRHVLVNPLKIDWPNFAANYKEVISLAVDAESADGRAFVTEYAGPSDVVSTAGVYDERWNADAFRTIDPLLVMDEMVAQGFWGCGFDPVDGFETCGFQHPLAQQLVQQYLPAPDGVPPEAFYDCVECYADMVDTTLWNGDAFADGLQSRVIDPGRNAADAVANHPYLTRMYTTISPAEMTEDPMFHETTMLEDVPNVRQAQQRILCNGDSLWTLPDGRQVYVPSGQGWPSFDGIDAGLEGEPAQMPLAERIADIPAAGAPMDLVDNTPIIDAKLAAWNEMNGLPAGGMPAAADDDGSSSGSSSGCGCTTTPGRTAALWLLALGLGLATTRRRTAP